MTNWDRIWHDPLYRLVLFASVAQLVLLLSTLVSIVVIRLRREAKERREARRDERVRAPLFRYLAGDIDVVQLVEATRQEPRAEVAAAIAPFVPTLDGASLDRLAHFYEASGLAAYGQRLATSGFWWRRLEGMRILAGSGGRVGHEKLEMALGDPHPVVRLAAARGLGRTGDGDYLRPLVEAARRGRTSRLQIAEVLIELGGPALPSLRALVMELPDDAEHSAIRATALEVLALTGDVDAAPYIRFALESADMEVRTAAFRAARLLNLNLSVDELRYGLQDPEWPVRAVAAQTVASLRETALIGELVVLLSDGEWWVRDNAARSLFALGPPGAQALVELLENGGDGFARDMARRTLTEDPTYAAYLLPPEEAA